MVADDEHAMVSVGAVRVDSRVERAASVQPPDPSLMAIRAAPNLDLRVVETEFTLVGVNPALDQFKDLARELREESEEQARRHGRELSAALAAAS
jgi:hypothetical protein